MRLSKQTAFGFPDRTDNRCIRLIVKQCEVLTCTLNLSSSKINMQPYVSKYLYSTVLGTVYCSDRSVIFSLRGLGWGLLSFRAGMDEHTGYPKTAGVINEDISSI